MIGSWREIYGHDAQALYAPLVVPLLFLVHRALAPARRAGAVAGAEAFVRAYAIVFAIETLLDPIATGPLSRWLGISESAAGTALLLAFVLLGDFRVFLLVFAVAALAAGRPWRGEIGRAVAWTLIVPSAAFAIHRSLVALFGSLPDDAIWLVYELDFLAMALYLRARWVPPHAAPGSELSAYLRAVTAYAAVYYSLWAAADVLIQIAGADAGWALRMLPNQLYYGLWIPFVYFRFFAPRYQSTSMSAQAAR